MTEFLSMVITTIDTPMTLFFLIVGIFLTLFLQFPQLFNVKHFLQIIQSKQVQESGKHTITPLQALFTAMSTSLGMGNIVGPPLAIIIGGPGALFWLVAFSFFGAVTKF